MLKFTIVGPKRDNTTTELVPDWTKANYEAMEKEIGEMNWEQAFHVKSGPEQWQLFKEKLNDVIEANVPKKIRRKGSKPLWMKKMFSEEKEVMEALHFQQRLLQRLCSI